MKVLTANRLADGAVVYLAASGWTERLEAAVRLEDDAASAALARAESQGTAVVGPYLVDADAAGVVGRERLRETIRATGPTVGHSLDAR